jgi:Mg2+-importing ATPase
MPLKLSEKNIVGLNQLEVKKYLDQFGTNEIYVKKKLSWLQQLWRLFKNPLVIILLVAAILSAVLGEVTSAVVIIGMILFSVCLDFYQEFKTGREVEKLQEKLMLTAAVIRDSVKKEIFAKFIVPHDIIVLSAGDIVPADGFLIDADDLFIDEAALTGESLPVEKVAAIDKAKVQSNQKLFAGTNVISGTGYLEITATGISTEFGKIAKSLQQTSPINSFEKGVRSFGYLIVRLTIFIVLTIFLIIITKPLLHHLPLGQSDLLQAFLFAIAVAVGLTPELLPMILSINMAKGSILMAKKGVMVKRLNAIPDFGSIDVLCTDKTGTLTEGKISLVKYLDVQGNTSDNILQMVYVNSFFQTGLKNPLDAAVLEFKDYNMADYKKIDEIPYDFNRKRLSLVVEHQDKRFMYTKGQPEEILKICSSYEYNKDINDLNELALNSFNKIYNQLSMDGFKVLAVCGREVVNNLEVYTVSEEKQMILFGLIAFFDPPKKTAKKTLKQLEDYGVEIKVITGDNELVTKKICNDLDIPVKGILIGDKIEKINDEALQVLAEKNTIFARFSPQQKNRVITALRKRGNVVGYMGDGINDAPSLKTADVGISVHNAVDVARESADIVLMHKSLEELTDGIIEGRKTFGNTMKYMMMGISSNFGNMFSLIFAVSYLPFLPMLPYQILLNNSLYDLSQVTIPSDNVDVEYLRKPKHWNMAFLKKFMFIFGSISSIFDILTFVLLYNFFRLAAPAFQTGWFIESLATQTLVIYVIRTRRVVFKSAPSKYLAFTTLTVVLFGAILPYTFLGSYFSFVPLKFYILLAIFGLIVIYLILVEFTKHWFYRRFEEKNFGSNN